VGFEPTIPASVRAQTYALDRAAAGIGGKYFGGLKSLIRDSVVGVLPRLRTGRFGFKSGQ
jgi:hypothetical protein